ncbi:hypothetical protein [Pseudomonas huanghezhanensis]|uniref:hypothetical protein n=1 Tax=Pseudomonas huanghezhanensis TaxID=3002903 RepID=UPI00228569FE|nr:hypothetical protein [Pseudomonas sp. BSw22131]
MNEEEDKLVQFRNQSNRVRDQRAGLTAFKRLDAVGEELDSTLNFRVNSGLKAEFEKLCRQSESNIARELKLYMRAAITAGRLL